jgi:lipid-binding SYLF domain-containing protein
MRRRRVLIILTLLCITQAPAALSSASGNSSKPGDAADESAKAAKTLEEIMGIPEEAIPETVLDSAECVAVFPSTIKGGFIVGVRKGEGVVSCRTPSGWSAPLYLPVFLAQVRELILVLGSDGGLLERGLAVVSRQPGSQ